MIRPARIEDLDFDLLNRLEYWLLSGIWVDKKTGKEAEQWRTKSKESRESCL